MLKTNNKPTCFLFLANTALGQDSCSCEQCKIRLQAKKEKEDKLKEEKAKEEEVGFPLPSQFAGRFPSLIVSTFFFFVVGRKRKNSRRKNESRSSRNSSWQKKRGLSRLIKVCLRTSVSGATEPKDISYKCIV